ncbi:hypothetical protein FRB95_014665 [Tulasnella sp. JGI-2019a]|nr:hypothetical protein FRB95_014665 [Tulasnella sp. JGI-2019a]
MDPQALTTLFGIPGFYEQQLALNLPPKLPPDQPTSPLSFHPSTPVSKYYDPPYNLSLNTTAQHIIWYPPEAFVEYPETSVGGTLHVFQGITPATILPHLNIVYSLGSPKGQSTSAEPRKCKGILVDAQGNDMLCVRKLRTCQGSKVCPHADLDMLVAPHTKASCSDISDRFRTAFLNEKSLATSCHELYDKTIAFFSSLTQGCLHRHSIETEFTPEEREAKTLAQARVLEIRRGQKIDEGLCEGRLKLMEDAFGGYYIQCEHYPPESVRDHRISGSLQESDTNHLIAPFDNDQEALDAIEEKARSCGYGGLTACPYTTNSTSKRVICPYTHVNPPTLHRIPCAAKFIMYIPLDLNICPNVAILCQHEHPHPIPTPSKTPPAVACAILDTLLSMGSDVATLTPRRFMQHPVTRAMLRK